jgi:hypothetical protein
MKNLVSIRGLSAGNAYKQMMWLQNIAQRGKIPELIRRKFGICDLFTRVKLAPDSLLFLAEL